jgi:hypothetical protein
VHIFEAHVWVIEKEIQLLALIIIDDDIMARERTKKNSHAQKEESLESDENLVPGESF